MNTFEDYLKENHAKHYRGLDDEMPDAYEKWVTELDLSTVMELAEEFNKEQYNYIKEMIDIEIDCIENGNALTPYEQEIVIKACNVIKYRLGLK